MVAVEIHTGSLTWLDVMPLIKHLDKKGANITASMVGHTLRVHSDQKTIDTLKEEIMRKLQPINRDLGTKKACIARLRRDMASAAVSLDMGNIHTALFILETSAREIRNALPKEKIVKPFKG